MNFADVCKMIPRIADVQAQLDQDAGHAVDCAGLHLNQMISLTSGFSIAEYEERAAVLEYDAGLPRAKANERAWWEQQYRYEDELRNKPAKPYYPF